MLFNIKTHLLISELLILFSLNFSLFCRIFHLLTYYIIYLCLLSLSPPSHTDTHTQTQRDKSSLNAQIFVFCSLMYPRHTEQCLSHHWCSVMQRAWL